MLNIIKIVYIYKIPVKREKIKLIRNNIFLYNRISKTPNELQIDIIKINKK